MSQSDAVVEQIDDFRGFTYIIKQVELALRPPFNAVCQEAGLTMAQATALSVLQRWPGVTSSELARRSFVKAQTMAANVDPLLEAGLVRRETDPSHARRQLLFLTDDGVALVERLLPGVATLERGMVDGLSREERDQLLDLLRRCRRNLQ